MRESGFGERRYADGVQAARAREGGREVLWLFVDGQDGPAWDRIAVDRSRVAGNDEEVAWASATAFRVTPRTPARGLRKVADALLRRRPEETWTLPDGTPVERQGFRRTDLLVAWSTREAPLDEGGISSRWPRASRVRRLGDGLYLVEGVNDTGPDASGSASDRPAEPPTDVARRLVDDARRRGDRLGEAIALADLGLTLANTGPAGAAAAVETLGQAAEIFRDLKDGPREADALGNLGLALLNAGRPADAIPALDAAFRLAERTGEAYARKLILERLSVARSNLGDPAGALQILDEAVRSTRALGDRHQEWHLHWGRAIALADLGRRDLASQAAEESISLLRALGRPEAAWYEEQLRRFRDEASNLAPVLVASHSTNPASSGPGILRMAISASKAMATFLASGMKTTPPDLRAARLATCRPCEHHTGLRCRVCGCFTEAKSRMAHERCPLGKWPG